jgi:phenylpropionate dioxygenase-like ring-hydroxylating dioxygenase large terminal subunit
MQSMIEGYGLSDLVPTSSSSTAIRSNWKLYQENALEPYHTDTVHRTSHNPAPARLSAFYDFKPTDGAIITSTGFAESSELFAGGEDVVLPQIPTLSNEQQGRLLFVAVLPVLFLLFEPGSVLVTLALPTGAGSMTLQTFSLYPRAATEWPNFATAVVDQATALNVILGEDVTTQEALQRGHASRFTPSGTLSWLESTLPQMNQWLAKRYKVAFEAAIAAQGSQPRSSP